MSTLRCWESTRSPGALSLLSSAYALLQLYTVSEAIVRLSRTCLACCSYTRSVRLSSGYPAPAWVAAAIHGQ